jgi:hypothetical protein
LARRINRSLPAKSFPGFVDEGEVDDLLIAAISQHLPHARYRSRLLACGSIDNAARGKAAGMFS